MLIKNLKLRGKLLSITGTVTVGATLSMQSEGRQPPTGRLALHVGIAVNLPI